MDEQDSPEAGPAAALSLVDDATLVESLAAWRAIASRAQAMELAATAELLRRRPSRRWDHRDDQDLAPQPVRISREAVSELALALNLTTCSAETQTYLAATLTSRLPRTFARMHDGLVDYPRMRLITEQTSLLDDEDAARVDAAVADKAGDMTTGKLRYDLRRLVIKANPAEAEKRRERAEKRSRVRLYANPEGTATLAAENIPAAHGAAAKARIAAIALALKAAGIKGTKALLESQVMIGLILGTLPLIPPPADDATADDATGGGDTEGGGTGGPNPDGPAAPGNGPDAEETDDGETAAEETDAESAPWPLVPATGDQAGPGCVPLPPAFRPRDAKLALLLPWRTATGTGAGTGAEPAELTWAGHVTRSQAVELALAATDDTNAAWNIIVTDDEGVAIAFTTLRRPVRGQHAPGPVAEVTLTITASLAEYLSGDPRRLAARSLGDDPRAARLAQLLADAIPAATKAAAEADVRALLDAEAGGCAHTQESKGYPVPDSMRRWLDIRNRTCVNPTCRRPARRCDQDHTVAYHKGGRTCPCNLGPHCRSDHQLKQIPGWSLSQPKPGHFALRTPAGLTYYTAPDAYPV